MHLGSSTPHWRSAFQASIIVVVIHHLPIKIENVHFCSLDHIYLPILEDYIDHRVATAAQDTSPSPVILGNLWL